MSKDKGAFMKRFYKVNENKIIEFGFNNNANIWYADLIDITSHTKISTIGNTEQAKAIANIVNENWFSDNIINFSRFIEDVIKL